MEDLEGLLNSIQNNQAIWLADVHGFFVEKLGAGNQTRFWETIADLPQLKVLNFNYFLDACLTAATLKLVLGGALGVSNISINDAKLCMGSSRKISLQNHELLTTVRISQLHLIGELSTLDPLIRMCASAPNLKTVKIHMARPRSNLLALKSVQSLAQTGIEKLELLNVPLDSQTMSYLMGQLTDESSTLGTYLKELTLDCGEFLTSSACSAIGGMLQTNSRLGKLALKGSRVEESGIVHITNGLKVNRKLWCFQMSQENVLSVPEREEAFLDMLQHNYYLESIALSRSNNNHAQSSFFQKIDFYLTMNSTQIRRLLLNVNVGREQILDKVVTHSNSLDYVYHLLGGNPHFMAL